MICHTPFVWHIEVVKLTPTPKKWNFWAIHIVENNCSDFFGGENWGSYSWNWVFILFLLYYFCWYTHTGRLVWNTQYIYFICYKSSVGLFESQTHGDNDSTTGSSYPRNRRRVGRRMHLCICIVRNENQTVCDGRNNNGEVHHNMLGGEGGINYLARTEDLGWWGCLQ